MKRLAVILILAALAAVPVLADCQNGIGTFQFVVVGPELHDNLWQFASVRGWQALSSSATYDGTKNHARMSYTGSAYLVGDTSCGYGLLAPDGTELVIVAEYASDPNTPAQRAFVAATSFAAAMATGSGQIAPIPDATMREVPPASAANNLGTVTVSWTPPPSQPEVIGYRIVRSADGIAGWTTVADVAAGVASQTNAPGPGTWYYAVQLRYLGSPTQQVSPYGLAATVTIP